MQRKHHPALLGHNGLSTVTSVGSISMFGRSRRSLESRECRVVVYESKEVFRVPRDIVVVASSGDTKNNEVDCHIISQQGRGFFEKMASGSHNHTSYHTLLLKDFVSRFPS